jgi:hypothetical protein
MKYWRIPKILAGVQNIGGCPKYWRVSKILAGVQNIGGCPKYWRVSKILAGAQNIGACRKSGGLTVQARRNLLLLTSSWSGWRALFQILVDVLPLRHVDPKWEMDCLHAAFICTLSPVLYRLVVPARQAKICAAIQNLCGPQNFRQPRIFWEFSPILRGWLLSS